MRPLVLLFLSFIAASVNNVFAQVSFGPEIGANVGGYIINSYGTNQDSKLKGSVRAGGKVDIGLCGRFHLQTGVLYVNNGALPPTMAGGAETSMNISTIEVPVNLIYRFKGTPITRPFLGVGPYMAFNVGGSATYNDDIWPNPYPIPVGSNTITRPLRVGNAADDDIRMFDAGAGACAGLQLASGLYAIMLYQRGFVNLQPQGDANNTIKNYNFAISLGYLFHCNHTQKISANKK